MCKVELQEGGNDTLKLECHCREELALAHRECAVIWFGIRGERTCEICHKEVTNVPLMRYPTFRFIRVWQHEPVLVIVSMLAYLVFLMIFLIKEMDDDNVAAAMSLTFGCLLGLLGSMASAIMVRRRYAWIYSAVEFILVICFAYAFSYLQPHLSVIICALLATVVGFVGPVCFTYTFWKWRGSHRETQRRR